MNVEGAPGYQETIVGWVPQEWKVKFIGEMTDVGAGGTPATSNESYWNPPEVPWMSSGEVHLRRVFSTEKKISSLGLKHSAAKVFPKKSIVMALAGQGKTRGCVAVLEAEVATNQSLAAIYPADCFETDYLFHNLDWRYKELRALSSGEGGRGGLNLSIIKSVPLALPPLREQKKIASILTSLDDKLDVIARQIETTQTLLQGLMQTLFSRGVGTQDVGGRWLPHTEFKESEIGEIPAGWNVATVGDVCEVKGGKRLPKGEALTEDNTGYPYIRVTDMYMGGVNMSGLMYVPAHIQPSIARYTISKDDIFISVAGTLGLVGLIPDELDGANLTENADKLCDIKISRDYLFYCLRSDFIQEVITREATSNAQPKLALSRIREFKFPLPPAGEQEQIATTLRATDEKLQFLSLRKSHCQTLKRGLMQKLLTGEWRVKLDADMAT